MGWISIWPICCIMFNKLKTPGLGDYILVLFPQDAYSYCITFFFTSDQSKLSPLELDIH